MALAQTVPAKYIQPAGQAEMASNRRTFLFFLRFLCDAVAAQNWLKFVQPARKLK